MAPKRTQRGRPKPGRKCHVNYAVMLKADELELIADDPSEIPPWRRWARSIGKSAKKCGNTNYLVYPV